MLDSKTCSLHIHLRDVINSYCVSPSCVLPSMWCWHRCFPSWAGVGLCAEWAVVVVKVMSIGLKLTLRQGFNASTRTGKCHPWRKEIRSWVKLHCWAAEKRWWRDSQFGTQPVFLLMSALIVTLWNHGRWPHAFIRSRVHPHSSSCLPHLQHPLAQPQLFRQLHIAKKACVYPCVILYARERF